MIPTTETMGLFEPINLDDIGSDPEDFERASHVLSLLAAYADSKARAARWRTGTGTASGGKAHGPAKPDIECAISAEKCAEATYRRVPIWARW